MSAGISDRPQIAARREALARRTRNVRILRIALPAFAALVFAAVLAAVGVRAFLAGSGKQVSEAEVTQLTAPKLLGADAKGRPFAITARGASRDPAATYKINLDHPVMVSDENGPDASTLIAPKGVFDERSGRLELSGGVSVTGARGDFQAPSSVFDTKTGQLVGGGAVQGSGGFGEIEAGGFEGSNNGATIHYKGGVRGRINP